MDRSPQLDRLEKQFRKNPGSRLFFPLAEGYRNNGEYEQAVEIYRLGLANHPNYVSARVSLARTLMELERYDQAKSELVMVVESAPENLMAHKLLAEVYVNQGELPSAIDQLKAILELNPDDREARVQIGQLSEAIPDVPADRPEGPETKRVADVEAVDTLTRSDQSGIDFNITELPDMSEQGVEETDYPELKGPPPVYPKRGIDQTEEQTDRHDVFAIMAGPIAGEQGDIAHSERAEETIPDAQAATGKGDTFFDDSGLDAMSTELSDFHEDVISPDLDDLDKDHETSVVQAEEMAEEQSAADDRDSSTTDDLVDFDALFEKDGPDEVSTAQKIPDSVLRDTRKLYVSRDAKTTVSEDIAIVGPEDSVGIPDEVGHGEETIAPASETQSEGTVEDDLFFDDDNDKESDFVPVNQAVEEGPNEGAVFSNEVEGSESITDEDDFIFDIPEEQPVQGTDTGQSDRLLGPEHTDDMRSSDNGAVASRTFETHTFEGPEDDDFAVEFDVVGDEENTSEGLKDVDDARPITAPPGDVRGGDAKILETETLARLYEEQGHFQEAIVVYEKLLSQSPRNSRYFHKIEKLRDRIIEVSDVRSDMNKGPEEGGVSVFPVDKQVLLQTLERYQKAVNVIRSQRGLI